MTDVPAAPPAPAAPLPVARGAGRAVVVTIVACLVLAAATLAAATIGRPAVPEPAAGSPTAVVEAYAAAVATGDATTAWAQLSEKAQAGVPFDEFEISIGSDGSLPMQLVVTGETIDGTSATVTGEVRFGDDSFGGEMTEPVTIPLARDANGAWRIDTMMYGLYPAGDWSTDEF